MKEDQIPKETDSFVLGESIGAGSFSVVYKAVNKATDTTIAIKSYRMKVATHSHITRAATEIAFLKSLKHPNIISYICSDIKQKYMYLGIEYSPYGTLTDYLKRQDKLLERSVQRIMKQLISALCYLHDLYIYHGDIKPENIIVVDEKTPTIKLTDFGLAEVLLKNRSSQRKAGSFFYMAPEILLGFPVDCQSDLFSTGVLLYEMIYREKPFPAKMTRDEYVSIVRKKTPISYPKPLSMPPNCLNLMKNLLSYDKEERLMGTKLMNHPYLKGEVIIKDEENHYFKAYECFLKGVDFVKEKKYGTAYIDIIEAILHLKIHASKVEDKGFQRYVLMKIQEFTKFGEKIIQRIQNENITESLEMQSDTERLRYLLQSSPELITGFDLCVVGEMYIKQSVTERGKDLLKNGLEMLIEKSSNEPEGARKNLLGSKMTEWMALLEEESGQGTSQASNP